MDAMLKNFVTKCNETYCANIVGGYILVLGAWLGHLHIVALNLYLKRL